MGKEGGQIKKMKSKRERRKEKHEAIVRESTGTDFRIAFVALPRWNGARKVYICVCICMYVYMCMYICMFVCI